MQYVPLGLLTFWKKEIINPFLNPRRGTYGKFQGEKSDNGNEKEERTRQGPLLQYEPFIEGYGSSTITESLCWLLSKFKGFEKRHVEPATEYPFSTCCIHREAQQR